MQNRESSTFIFGAVMFRKLWITTLFLCGSFAPSFTYGTVILSTDFAGIQADPSNINWTESAVSVTNTMVPLNSGSSPLTLFGNRPDMFAVRHNIHDFGLWFTDIEIMSSASVSNILLDTLSLDASIVNNFGSFQQVQRDLSFSLEIFSDISSIYNQTIVVFNGDANTTPFNATRGISFDLSSINLLGDSGYTFRLTASGSGVGNNAGFDNLVLQAESVTPQVVDVSSVGTFGLLIIASIWVMRRKAKM